jgi:hypothetical protein
VPSVRNTLEAMSLFDVPRARSRNASRSALRVAGWQRWNKIQRSPDLSSVKTGKERGVLPAALKPLSCNRDSARFRMVRLLFSILTVAKSCSPVNELSNSAVQLLA